MIRPARLPLFAVGAGLLMVAYMTAAYAAVHLDNPTIAIRPEAATDAMKPDPACMVEQRPAIYLKLSDGRMALIAVMPC